MTPEIALYLLGAASIPLLSFCVGVWFKIKKIDENMEKIVSIHLEDIIKDNTRALKALTHYILWLSKSQSNEEPPPLIGDIDES